MSEEEGVAPKVAIGISFGNSYSSIAYTTGEGKAEVIANEEGGQTASTVQRHKLLRMALTDHTRQTVKYRPSSPTFRAKSFTAHRPRLRWCGIPKTASPTFETFSAKSQCCFWTTSSRTLTPGHQLQVDRSNSLPRFCAPHRARLDHCLFHSRHRV